MDRVKILSLVDLTDTAEPAARCNTPFFLGIDESTLLFWESFVHGNIVRFSECSPQVQLELILFHAPAAPLLLTELSQVGTSELVKCFGIRRGQ
jgi:hypothetical protein